MRANVDVQDRAMRVPRGRSRLREMPVPGEVCQSRAPDSTGGDTDQGGHGGKGGGKQKRRRGNPKEGKPAQHTMRERTGKVTQGKGKDESSGSTATEKPPEEGKDTDGYVPGYTSTPENLRLREVYGDWIHANPGTHLDGGVRDDSAWKAWWRDLAVMPSRRFDTPSGRFRRKFVRTLGKELKGVLDR